MRSAKGDNFGGDVRDDVEMKMLSSDIASAQLAAHQCRKKNYKGCDDL